MNATDTLPEGNEATVHAARILVVEDERIVARSLRAQLTALGYDVIGSVATAPKAVQQAKEFLPDLVLMDINLEGPMDGVEAAAIIRQKLRLPVVYLTAYSNKEILDRAKITEPFGYILKPYDERELHVVIETAMYKHRMEQRQLERERWFVATLRSIGDAVVAVEDEGNITYMNPLAERLTGWRSADAVGRPLNEIVRLLHEDTRQPVDAPLSQSTHDGAMNADILLIAKDGTERALEDSVSTIKDEEGVAVGRVIVFRDVTWRKQLEAQARQLQKIEAVGQLAGGVAHEFNNLLTIMNGYCEIVMATMPDSNNYKDLLGDALKAGHRAATLTSQLLSFSRKQVLASRVLDLNEVLENSKETLQSAVGKDVKLVTDFDPWLNRVKVDLCQIEHVLRHLALNSRDAMPHGGIFTVATYNIELDAELCRQYPGSEPGHYIALIVSDTGHGMSPGVKNRIFEPFFTTKAVGKGTGMGLAMVFGIVKQFEGYIAVQSQQGVGTTFKIFLPAVKDKPVAAPSNQAKGLDQRGSETVLLAEDEDGVRNIVRHMLENKGYKVLEARNGQEAMELAKRHAGPIHMILTDVAMPEMSGRKLVEFLRALHPGLKVLYMSGFTDDSVVLSGIQEDADAFLQKPFSTPSLTTKVREVLDRKA